MHGLLATLSLGVAAQARASRATITHYMIVASPITLSLSWGLTTTPSQLRES